MTTMKKAARYIALAVWLCIALAGVAGILSGNPLHILTLFIGIFFSALLIPKFPDDHEPR